MYVSLASLHYLWIVYIGIHGFSSSVLSNSPAGLISSDGGGKEQTTWILRGRDL